MLISALFPWLGNEPLVVSCWEKWGVLQQFASAWILCLRYDVVSGDFGPLPWVSSLFADTHLHPCSLFVDQKNLQSTAASFTVCSWVIAKFIPCTCHVLVADSAFSAAPKPNPAQPWGCISFSDHYWGVCSPQCQPVPLLLAPLCAAARGSVALLGFS